MCLPYQRAWLPLQVSRPKLKIGIVLDGRASASAMADLARLAEKNGIENLWLSAGARTKDHFVRLEVAALYTTKIRLVPVATSPLEMRQVFIGTEVLTHYDA